VLGGCAADSGDEGMLILKNVRADTMCMLTSPSETETFVSEGRLDSRLDLEVPSEYLFIAQVKSRVTALAGQEDQRKIIMTDAKIDLTFPDSKLFDAAELATFRTTGVTHFKQLFSAPLAPNGGLTDVGFVLIPSSTMAALSPKVNASQPPMLQVVATFTIEGDMSGETVVSQPFTYPITIGRGVSVNVPEPPGCPLTKGTTVRTGYACNPVQDGTVDCCMKSSGLLQCPASVAM
jgi:hypothetical protein